MKLIMENFRKFVNEDVYGEKFLKTLGLTYQIEDDEFLVQVVHKNEINGQLKVIGMIETMEMGKRSGGRPTPCIPETYEIGAVAVDSAFQSKGLGTWLYEVVAVLISQRGEAGLTSDHSSSTTNDAASVWKRLEKDLNYEKRKTAKGSGEEEIDMKTGEVTAAYDGENDKFDYNNSTPDPNDDCYPPVEGEAASNHSLKIPQNRMQEVAILMQTQIDNYDSWTENKSFGSQDLASKLFNIEYKPEKSGIYGDEK
jgi:ribosomal protein S18 acetylase RimI-like enzyme